MNLAPVIFLSIGISWSSCFTISSERDTLLPTQTILNDEIVRMTSDGQIITIQCPAGTRLDKTAMICAFVEDKENPLGISALEGKEEEICIPGKTKKSVLPAFEDCRHFVLCGSSGSFKMECPGTMLFNEHINACDYMETAHCCEYPEKNSSRLLQRTE
ncbi:unnamed protein product [Callosobruchus maculatus]|uniref:Chitin-binding type-2 domain-containing protein n=1 Tax=Callosobruchus maculatus TaxID=64391 RepID=A0A653DKH9_CALMS|nr:unnamed protein product [Callosobruchus maculatus]